MRSRLFLGETTHHRRLPEQHRFRYRMFWLALDLAELDGLCEHVVGLERNRAGLMALHDRDYGGPGPGTIRSKILARLREAGMRDAPARITLITIPRVAGYVFNPVSFYLCYTDEDTLMCLVAEVRNTFGEMHHYVAEPAEDDGDATVAYFRFPKSFYVSPFLDVHGWYELQLRARADELHLTVNLQQDGQLIFSASMRGRGRPITSSRLLGTLMAMPLFAASIMLKIHWQALLLRLARRIPTRAKAAPMHRSTLPAAEGSLWYRLRAWIVRLAASHDRTSPAESRAHSIETRSTTT